MMNKNISLIYRYNNIIIVVTIFLLGLLIIFKNTSLFTPDPSILYAQYFQQPPIKSDIVTKDLEPLLQVANTAYQNEDYPQAIKNYEKIVSQTPDNFAVEFYLGICYLEENQLDFAIITFENLVENALSQKHEALWYLALSHLKNKDLNSCKSILKQLIKDKSIKKITPIKTQAKKLLKEI